MESALTGINLDDLVSAFGWEQRPWLRAMLRFCFRGPAQKFSTQMLAFDGSVGSIGLPQAAGQMLSHYVRHVRLFGSENLPSSGPLLVLSNHPGMTDTLCLFAALRRPDLLIIALRRPFLQALPNTSSHLIFLGDDPADRIAAIRKASSHLRAGGAVLTFPAGQIEPDPDVYEGAGEALEEWLDSAGVFMRFVPETTIVPVLVRNVLWERVVRHPLTRLRSGRAAREQLGASLQLLVQILFNTAPLTVKVQAATPIRLAEVGSTAVSAIHATVLERMRSLLHNPPVGEGLALL